MIKGKVAIINEDPETKNLILEAEDIMSGRKVKEEVEMAILATGIVPNIPENANLLTDDFGFNTNIQKEMHILFPAL